MIAGSNCVTAKRRGAYVAGVARPSAGQL